MIKPPFLIVPPCFVRQTVLWSGDDNDMIVWGFARWAWTPLSDMNSQQFFYNWTTFKLTKLIYFFINFNNTNFKNEKQYLDKKLKAVQLKNLFLTAENHLPSVELPLLCPKAETLKRNSKTKMKERESA